MPHYSHNFFFIMFKTFNTSIFRKGLDAFMTGLFVPIMPAVALFMSAAMSTPLKGIISSTFIPGIMGVADKEFRSERQELLLRHMTGSAVLDVGCGGGAYLKYCSKANRVVANAAGFGLSKLLVNTGDEGRLGQTPLRRQLRRDARDPDRGGMRQPIGGGSRVKGQRLADDL